MKNFFILLLMCIFLFISNTAKAKHKNHLVYYEPAKVVLSGKLDLQTFPGPPNYESIKSGDEIETHFYLKLNRAINVVP